MCSVIILGADPVSSALRKVMAVLGPAAMVSHDASRTTLASADPNHLHIVLCAKDLNEATTRVAVLRAGSNVWVGRIHVVVLSGAEKESSLSPFAIFPSLHCYHSLPFDLSSFLEAVMLPVDGVIEARHRCYFSTLQTAAGVGGLGAADHVATTFEHAMGHLVKDIVPRTEFLTVIKLVASAYGFIENPGPRMNISEKVANLTLDELGNHREEALDLLNKFREEVLDSIVLR